MTNNASLVKGMKLAAFLGLLIGIFNFFMMQVFVDNVSIWLRWGFIFLVYYLWHHDCDGGYFCTTPNF